MLSDIDNARKLMLLLGDEGFTKALTEAEELVEDANDTLDRVEEIEDEAAEAVREANETMLAVDRRLDKVDRTINLLEAKIEAGFSLAFFVFAANAFVSGELLFAAGLTALGLLGAGQLAVTIANIPQVEKLQAAVVYLLEWLNDRLKERTDDGADGRQDDRFGERADDGADQPDDRKATDDGTGGRQDDRLGVRAGDGADRLDDRKAADDRE
jgi:hypothetical protein